MKRPGRGRRTRTFLEIVGPKVNDSRPPTYHQAPHKGVSGGRKDKTRYKSSIEPTGLGPEIVFFIQNFQASSGSFQQSICCHVILQSPDRRPSQWSYWCSHVAEPSFSRAVCSRKSAINDCLEPQNNHFPYSGWVKTNDLISIVNPNFHDYKFFLMFTRAPGY